MASSPCGILCCVAAVAACLVELSNSEVREYCQEESFRVTCPQNQVLQMESAVYGRPKLGRCVKRDLGYLGCNRSAIHVLDSRCGGQTACDVSIMDPALRDLNPCAKDVTWHLFASYRCVEVVVGSSFDCQTKKNAVVPGVSGYLSSSMSSRTSVGSASCPWLIQTDHGQRINLTLWNFVSARSAAAEGGFGHHSGSAKQTEVCYEVGFIRESSVDGQPLSSDSQVTRKVTACSSEPRMRNIGLFTSAGNAIEVEFSVRNSGSSFKPSSSIQFLIYYEVLGCATLLPPFGATASRDLQTLVFKCNASGDSWSLTCDGHKWTGTMRNCTVPANHVWGGEDLFSQPGFPLGILLVVAVGVALGVFLGGSLLLLASMLMRRQRLSQRRHGAGDGLDDMKSTDDLDYGNHGDVDATDQKHYIVQDYVSKDFLPATNECPGFGADYGTSPPARDRAMMTRMEMQKTYPRILYHVYESPQLT